MDKQTAIAIVRIVAPAICSVVALFGYTADSEAWTNAAVLIVGAILSIPCAWLDNDVTADAKRRKELGTAALAEEKAGEN